MDQNQEDRTGVPRITDVGSLNITGTRNRRECCEDVIRIREGNGLNFYGIADGQSGKKHCIEGAQASLQMLERFIRQQEIEPLMAYPFPDELPCMLMQAVRSRLLQKAQADNFEEYASTLVAVAMEPESGRYLLAHLGDGCILGVRHDGAIVMLSPPENAVTRYHTWLTTSDGAVGHMRLAFGDLREYKRILLMSDGADSLCHGKNIPRQARELIRRGDRDDIFDYLRRVEPGDDCSCIVIDIAENPEAAHMAKPARDAALVRTG